MPQKDTLDDVAYIFMLSYPIVVSHLSFNFVRLLLLYSIYFGGWDPPPPHIISQLSFLWCDVVHIGLRLSKSKM